MLRSLKQLYGHKLRATDGEIGSIKDFYFDDQNWTIRYLIADTGTWLTSRKVLISPHSLASPAALGKVVDVRLTRKQIEKSPSIDSQKPVSRQYQEEYHKFFGWPAYWKTENATTVIGPQLEPEVHLRSTLAVSGYLLRRGDETIGHVCDFMIDAETWVIGQLVVKTGHRLSGKEILIPTKQVERVSHAESTVFTYLNAESAESTPAHNSVPAGIVL